MGSLGHRARFRRQQPSQKVRSAASDSDSVLMARAKPKLCQPRESGRSCHVSSAFFNGDYLHFNCWSE